MDGKVGLDSQESQHEPKVDGKVGRDSQDSSQDHNARTKNTGVIIFLAENAGVIISGAQDSSDGCGEKCPDDGIVVKDEGLRLSDDLDALCGLMKCMG